MTINPPLPGSAEGLSQQVDCMTWMGATVRISLAPLKEPRLGLGSFNVWLTAIAGEYVKLSF